MTCKNTARSDMDIYLDSCRAEVNALQRKLHSKVEALLILSKDLDQCRTERDQFKLMAEQIQDRYTILKKNAQEGLTRALSIDGLTECPGLSLPQLVCEMKEVNKSLRLEAEDLRQKLKDAQGDTKVLRAQLIQQRQRPNTGPGEEPAAFPVHQREELVQQLETLNQKCTQLAADLQAVLDEKEELVTERDAYKCKVHRLNHELRTLLGGGPALVDVDALVTENRYLQERLQQVEEEKELATQALSKYKTMLEKKRTKGAVRLGTGSSSGLVMSHKQVSTLAECLPVLMASSSMDQSYYCCLTTVQQLLEHGTAAQLPNTAATLSDMKCLCLALLEALGDKSLAVSHQKKANKILAGRIAELEQRLAAVHGDRVGAFLLDGYSGAEVDRDVGLVLAEDPPAHQAYPEPPAPSSDCVVLDCSDMEDVLPPQLEQAVQKALEDIRLEAKSS